MSIEFKNNMIIRDPNPEVGVEVEYYTFGSSYEITINECLVKNVINRVNGFPILHIDISETAAQQTLSDFVSEVADAVKLEKHININNIGLSLDFNNIEVIALEDDDVQRFKTQPSLLRGLRVDIVIEWTSFTIERNALNMGVNLVLTQLTIIDQIPEPEPRPKPLDVLTIIRETAPKMISDEQASELFQSLDCDSLSVTYSVDVDPLKLKSKS